MTLFKPTVATVHEYTLVGDRLLETLSENGLGDRYFNKLDTYPEKLVQVDAITGVTETASSLKTKACQVAAELLEKQITPNDIVAICNATRLEETSVIVGTLFVGAELAILDSELSKLEFTRKIEKLKPKVLFCDARILIELESIGYVCHVYVFGKNVKKNSICPLFTKKIPENFAPVPITNPDKKTAFIILTDGTTGSPKCVRITHSAAFARIIKLQNCLLKDIKKIISYFPLLGTAQVVLTCCSFETNIVRIIPSAFSGREACRIIHDLKVDAAILGTQHAWSIVDYNTTGQDYNIDCLKRIIIGGSVTTPANMMYYQSVFPNIQILNLYSVVECGLVAGLTIDDLDMIKRNPATMGKVFPGGKVKIVDFTTQKVLGHGKWGELCYSGQDLAASYFDELTEFLDNGYFPTGDIAQYDEHGCLYIFGRLDDKFDIQRNTFFAIDLESILITNPNVKDCVVAKNFEQLVVYVIVSEIGTKDIYKWLQKKVPPYMIPSMIYIVNDIPRTNNGKAKKYLMSKIISRKSIIDSLSD